jgi:hypothetical protein
MPVHDWTRVPAGIFHDFHCSWALHIKEALNEGLLPSGYYALIEQTIPVVRPDVIALSTTGAGTLRPRTGAAVMDPPRTKLSLATEPLARYRQARRTIAIRHVSGHQIVALIEIASPANKDRLSSVEQFVEKIRQAVTAGVHVLLVDLLPPGKFDPQGLHGAFWEEFGPESVEQPLDQPLCLSSYEAARSPQAFLEPISVGDALPDMPLFYEDGLYVQVPLEKTYDQAWRGVPEFWRDVIEGRRESGEGQE